MADSDGDKQHEATAHRREQAREEGQVARSHDLGSAGILLAALLGLLYFGPDLTNYFGFLFREYLGGNTWRSLDRDSLASWWVALIAGVAWSVVPLLGVVM